MKSLRQIYENFGAKFFSILQSRRGQTLVEYALLIVLIAVVVIIMLRGTGQQVNQIWSKINSGLNQ